MLALLNWCGDGSSAVWRATKHHSMCIQVTCTLQVPDLLDSARDCVVDNMYTLISSGCIIMCKINNILVQYRTMRVHIIKEFIKRFLAEIKKM